MSGTGERGRSVCICVCVQAACGRVCAARQGGGDEADVKGAEGLSTLHKCTVLLCTASWSEAGRSWEGPDCQIRPHPKMKFRNLSDSHLELVMFLPSITPLESYFINSLIWWLGETSFNFSWHLFATVFYQFMLMPTVSLHLQCSLHSWVFPLQCIYRQQS